MNDSNGKNINHGNINTENIDESIDCNVYSVCPVIFKVFNSCSPNYFNNENKFSIENLETFFYMICSTTPYIMSICIILNTIRYKTINISNIDQIYLKIIIKTQL